MSKGLNGKLYSLAGWVLGHPIQGNLNVTSVGYPGKGRVLESRRQRRREKRMWKKEEGI